MTLLNKEQTQMVDNIDISEMELRYTIRLNSALDFINICDCEDLEKLREYIDRLLDKKKLKSYIEIVRGCEEIR
jgi:hypothetical protein